MKCINIFFLCWPSCNITASQLRENYILFQNMATSATSNKSHHRWLLPPAYQQSSNEENFTNLLVVKAEIASVGDKSCSNIAALSQVEPAAMLQTGQQQDENYFVSTGTCIIYSFCSHIYTVLLFWDTFSVSSINYFTYKCPKLHTIKQELK